jgi:hypothetical protein
MLVLRGHASVYRSETFVRCRALLARKNTRKKNTFNTKGQAFCILRFVN